MKPVLRKGLRRLLRRLANINNMFLRSDIWRDFQERAGVKTISFGSKNDPWASVLQYRFGLVRLYSAYNSNHDEMIEFSSRNKISFITLEPMFEDENQKNILEEKKFFASNNSIQPTRTIVVSLEGDSDKILSRMKPKWRYNIKLSKKRGVNVEQGGRIEEFTRLMRETTKRDNFSAHPEHYYKELLKTKGVSLYTARVGGEAAAAAIIMEYEGGGFYLHGASDYKRRSYMSPFSLHWTIMEDLRRKGVTVYDLWGIDAKKWPGVTRFKSGFGGAEVSYIGSYDFILRPFLYRAFQIKKIFKI